MKVIEGGSHFDRYINLSMPLSEAIELQKVLSSLIFKVSTERRIRDETMNYNDGSGYPNYLNELKVEVHP